MGWGSSEQKTSSSVRDERIGAAEGALVIRGSDNVLMSAGDAVSQAAVEEVGDLAKRITDSAEKLGVSSADLAADLAGLMADVVGTQANASLEAREMDVALLDRALTENRNLADASIQNATTLAETKLTGGMGRLDEVVKLGLLIAGAVFAVSAMKK